MKDWFNYEFGYINVDEEANCIYFTHSGNWSEVTHLQERTQSYAVNLGKNSKRRKIVIGFVLLFFLAVALVVLSEGAISVGLAVLLVAGAYKLYNYMRTELGEAFKLPMDKIQSIDQNTQGLILVFYNGNNQICEYLISGLEERGLDYFEKLRSSKA